MILTEEMLIEMIQDEIRRFRTYGIGDFSPDKFKSPSNKAPWLNKPEGGLWASPVGEGTYGWKEWSKCQHFMAYDDDDYFEFVFKPGAKIYGIRTREDVARLPQLEVPEGQWMMISDFCLDFEKIAQVYDAIDYRNCWETSDAIGGAWDCDSILVLNPDAIEVVKHNTIEPKDKDYYHRLATDSDEDDMSDIWDDYDTVRH